MNSALSDNTDAENHQTEDISHPPVHFLSSARVTKPEGRSSVQETPLQSGKNN
jgi:hypothetical protein